MYCLTCSELRHDLALDAEAPLISNSHLPRASKTAEPPPPPRRELPRSKGWLWVETRLLSIPKNQSVFMLCHARTASMLVTKACDWIMRLEIIGRLSSKRSETDPFRWQAVFVTVGCASILSMTPRVPQSPAVQLDAPSADCVASGQTSPSPEPPPASVAATVWICGDAG